MEINKDELLKKLKELLKNELSVISYETWILPLGIKSIEGNHIVFTITSEYQRDFLEVKFKSLVFNTFLQKLLTNYNFLLYNRYTC